ncbi:MAG: type II toxin-antitoxin system PemK/MazF family toxin [Ignavibacteria bacterium]
MKYSQREIVLVPFPFSDLSTTKKRPVLIISNDDYNSKHDDVVVCVITSNKFKDDFSVVIKDDNLEYGFLPEESTIKYHKLFTINKSKIVKKFSIVNKELFETISKNLCALFKHT